MIPHQHLLIRSQISNPISDADQISSWILDLIKTIDMKVLYGPVSVYCDKTGNRGITGFAVIETSHIALHVWDETDPATLQLDVYTCSNLEIDLVFGALSLFHPVTIDYKFLDRESGFTEILESPNQVVKKWVSRISRKQPSLGGNKICPFAKMPRVVSVDKLSIEKFNILDDQITVYMEDSIVSGYEEMKDLCRNLKSLNANFVFLPDHPHKTTYINGIETGNGVFPCIIVQSKQELNLARSNLENTDYYSFWDNTYLKELKSFD